MLSLQNHVTLIGNIGSSTKITTFQNGNKVARFSLASDKEFRANNGKMKINTEWHKIFAWGNMAQFIEMYAEKGKKDGPMLQEAIFRSQESKLTPFCSLPVPDRDSRLRC
jgi:single-strand DNA-binding protein